MVVKKGNAARSRGPIPRRGEGSILYKEMGKVQREGRSKEKEYCE